MKQKNFEIKFVDNWPEDEILNLYKADGWWKESYDESKIRDLIKGSYAFAVVIEKKTNKTVGMGRILSDGISDAYLQDLIILSEYRKKGLGKYLVDELVKYCYSKNIKWIALISEPNQDGFYSNIGFKQMKKYIPMKYEE